MEHLCIYKYFVNVLVISKTLSESNYFKPKSFSCIKVVGLGSLSPTLGFQGIQKLK
jgi:hypothetical protein